VEHLGPRLAEIPGVVAVTLGGSRARGEAGPDSDWDFGLYYRGTIDPADIAALGWPGEITGPGGWGPVVNGGAWLTVAGERVDLCYRDLDEVLACVAEAERGRFEIHGLATYVAGIASYVVVGELACCKQLVGTLPRPSYPEALVLSAPPRWRGLSTMAMRTARAHAARGDVVGTVSNLGVAVVAEANARLAERREWALNEKGLVDLAGLGEAHAILALPGSSPSELGAVVAVVTALLGAGTVRPIATGSPPGSP